MSRGREEQAELARSVTQQIAEENDVIMIEDYDHGSQHVHRHIFSRDMVDTLDAGGVVNIDVEYVPEIRAISQLSDMGKSYAAGEKISAEEFDIARHNYAKQMTENIGITGMKSGSKAEYNAFLREADTFIYAGYKGINVNAVGSAETEPGARLDDDKNVADRVAEHAKEGKTAVIMGAAHGDKRDGKNGKDLDEHLEDRGLKVGKVGVMEDGKEFKAMNRAEVPNTIIQTDARTFGVDLPGGNLRVLQAQTNGEYRELGGEINTTSPEAFNTSHQKIDETDLSYLSAPTFSAGVSSGQGMSK